MKNKLILIAMLLGSSANAWVCEEMSSERQGNTISSCGIGINKDEPSARLEALQAAVTEFKMLCEFDSTCQGKKLRVEPNRTTCTRVPYYFEADVVSMAVKCYRMVTFTIQD